MDCPGQGVTLDKAILCNKSSLKGVSEMYMIVSTTMCVCLCVYLYFLALRRPRSNETTEEWAHLTAQILVAKYHSPLKETKAPWKIAHSKADTGKEEDDCNILCQKVRNWSKSDEDLSKGHHPKEAQLSQIHNVLASKQIIIVYYNPLNKIEIHKSILI